MDRCGRRVLLGDALGNASVFNLETGGLLYALDTSAHGGREIIGRPSRPDA